MRIVVPYAPIREWTPSDGEVARAMMATGCEPDYAHVGKSDRDYFDLLSDLWRVAETFCVVEHDIVIHPTALDELADCPNDWCGFPHEYAGELVYGMGCVKFGADLIARNPDAMIRVGTLFDANYPKRHWYRLDPWLQGVILPGRGEVKCKHPTTVGHLGAGIPPLHIPIPFR